MSKLKRKALKVLISLAMVPIAGFFILYGLIYLEVFGVLPSKEDLADIETFEASKVYSSDGVLLGTYHLQNRFVSSEIPTSLSDALLATEDVRFYEHDGVDYRATMRVLFKTILMGDRSAGGGSTLSQQLIKNIYPRNYHGFLSMPISKIKEIICAQRIEKVYQKDQIIWLYLNTVPFGDDVWGVETAAKRYFDKNLDELEIEEAACLIGMLKGPNLYHPIRNPENAKKRRNVVLSQMSKYDFLNDSLSTELKLKPLNTSYSPSGRFVGLAQHLREKARLELEEWCKSNFKADGSAYNLYTDGLEVTLTVDSRYQKALETSVLKNLKTTQIRFEKEWGDKAPYLKNSFLHPLIKGLKEFQVLSKQGLSDQEIIQKFKQPRQMSVWIFNKRVDTTMSVIDSLIFREKKLHCGAISMNPKTGAVLAWVGGDNFNDYPYDYVSSKRQVGSLFKPLVYMNALRNGYEACDFLSAKTEVYEEYENWSPSDGKSDTSYYSLAGALVNSINTITASLAIEFGVPSLLAVADEVGFKGDLGLDPSIALGSGSSSVENMAEVYSCLSTAGNKVKSFIISSISDSKGLVFQAKEAGFQKRSVDKDSYAELLSMLSLVADSGTAKSLRSRYGIKNELACKTGTTQNNADAWFAAVLENLTTVVWVGANSPQVHFRYTSTGQGATVSLPIVGSYLVELRKTSEIRKVLDKPLSNKGFEIYCQMTSEGKPKGQIVEQIKGWFKDAFEETKDSLNKPGLLNRVKKWLKKD